jgi:predicted ABC-type transport system involved in lysophospholipase L1 biosynthesis ATPase subunit
MRFHGAVIRERSATFAVVIVKPHTLRSAHEATRAQLTFAPAFRGMPIVLMAQDPTGAASFHGRRDLVAFMSKVNLDAVKWREYRLG